MLSLKQVDLNLADQQLRVLENRYYSAEVLLEDFTTLSLAMKFTRSATSLQGAAKTCDWLVEFLYRFCARSLSYIPASMHAP